MKVVQYNGEYALIVRSWHRGYLLRTVGGRTVTVEGVDLKPIPETNHIPHLFVEKMVMEERIEIQEIILSAIRPDDKFNGHTTNRVKKALSAAGYDPENFIITLGSNKIELYETNWSKPQTVFSYENRLTLWSDKGDYTKSLEIRKARLGKINFLLNEKRDEISQMENTVTQLKADLARAEKDLKSLLGDPHNY